MRFKNLLFSGFSFIVFIFPYPVFAHEATNKAGGFLSGFVHPLGGLDHIVAMIAVGLWGAFLGAPAIWLLPIVFPMVMAVGGAFGVTGIPLPAVEIGIALSGVLLGLAVLFESEPDIKIAAILVGFFAIFHGHAHGTALPGTGSPIAYAAGFVFSTGLIHLSGIVLGFLVHWPWGRIAVRAGGAGVALVGFGFLFGLL